MIYTFILLLNLLSVNKQVGININIFNHGYAGKGKWTKIHSICWGIQLAEKDPTSANCSLTLSEICYLSLSISNPNLFFFHITFILFFSCQLVSTSSIIATSFVNFYLPLTMDWWFWGVSIVMSMHYIWIIHKFKLKLSWNEK